MSDKRKSIPPKRPSRVNVPQAPRAPLQAPRPPHPLVRPAQPQHVTVTTKKETEAEAALLARVARAEEEVGQMLVRLTQTEARAQAAEARALAAEAQLAQQADDQLREVIEERDALKEALREAATVLVRVLRPGPRAEPPPLPPMPSPESVDVSEMAEMVESLRPPPHR